MMFQLVVVVLACLSSSWGEERLVEPVRWEMPPLADVDTSSRSVLQSWMPMPLDHFDPQNADTFQMRFMFNEDFFGGDGYPIFLLIGGEWDIHPSWLQAGNMFEMARENRGFMIYTEHRYYGATHIFNTFNAETLRFLNVDQALADLAYFIMEIKKMPRFANSKVILYGGSYAGNMALWFKQRYPHLVVGGVASSGPIKAQVDFTGYLEVVHQAFLAEGGQQCVNTIRQGLEDTIAALQTEAGRQTLQSVYRLCTPLDHTNDYALGLFNGLISWTFSTSVQQATPGSLTAICRNFATDFYGFTPLQRVAGYLHHTRNLAPSGCWNINYDSYLNTYRSGQVSNSVAWYYQTCTEYAYFQIVPTIGTAFDSLRWLTVDFYTDVCKSAFDSRYDETFVRDAVDRVNLQFGALEPQVNQTINIHGDVDPWHALGVVDQDISDSSPTIMVPRASHCFDMRSWQRSDTILMSQAQARARRTVARWLH